MYMRNFDAFPPCTEALLNIIPQVFNDNLLVVVDIMDFSGAVILSYQHHGLLQIKR